MRCSLSQRHTAVCSAVTSRTLPWMFVHCVKRLALLKEIIKTKPKRAIWPAFLILYVEAIPPPVVGKSRTLPPAAKLDGNRCAEMLALQAHCGYYTIFLHGKSRRIFLFSFCNAPIRKSSDPFLFRILISPQSSLQNSVIFSSFCRYYGKKRRGKIT